MDGLASALSDAGHIVDVVALPLSWDPPENLLTTALSWRLLDLSRFNNRTVDRVICTKYPTWAVNHPNKSLWLIHQHRQAYDLYGTPMSEFTPDASSRATRDRVLDIDRIGIGSCARRFSISQNVSERLRRFTGLDAIPLYPPVPRSGLEPASFEPFVLSVARLDASKRIAPLIDAWPFVSSELDLVIVGDGPDRDALDMKIDALGHRDRIRLLGRVDDAALRTLYNTCRAVYYAPIDEDYGYTTVEALAAGKPVVTAMDSGGVLEFVRDGLHGIVTNLDARSLAASINALSDADYARCLGSGGPQVTQQLTWDAVVTSLMGD